jgi:hypothetical protein
MRVHLLAASLALVAILTIPASAAAEVELRITGGRVWLKAVNATVGQILNEWSRLGQTEIVNGDRVPGGPVTLQLEDVSEEEALDVLLRSAAGFMGVRRTMSATAASEFDRILILPRSTAASASATASVARPVAAPAPVFAPPQPQSEAAPVFNQPGVNQPAAAPAFMPGVQRVLGPDGQPVPDDQDDDVARPPQPAEPPAPPQGSPEVPFGQPPGPPTGSATPGVPVGAPVPGMTVPAPRPPNQPPDGP